MKRYRRTPFLTRAQLAEIFDACERTPDGCLLYRPAIPLSNPNAIFIKGRHETVTRLVWAETYATTMQAQNDLDTHEVVHIAACPHTGDYDRTSGTPLCVEPSHLKLGDMIERLRLRRERKQVA